MRKPTGSSGIDDMTAKCQFLQRSLHQIEEVLDEMDEDEVSDEPEPTFSAPGHIASPSLTQVSVQSSPETAPQQDFINLELLRRTSGV